MKVLVTGTTGFIGANLVRELLQQGYQVRSLVRHGSNRRNIEGLDIEAVEGDLLDRPSLARALDGCEALFHVAAAYTFWSRNPKAIYETNITGTENILTAAREKGIARAVYTSTESTIGVKDGCLGTEDAESSLEYLAGDYKKSKLLAERLALRMCREGLPLVVVNPTMPIGPYDIKPTPTGQVVVDYLNGRMTACVNTTLNVVDVRDVARGHILALQKGRIGARYILGNRNLTLREILDILEDITGIPAPRFNIPIWLAFGAACVDEFISGHILGKQPRIPIAAVRTARHRRHFDCSRAINELGLTQSPVEEAFARAARWFQQNGYVRKPCPKAATLLREGHS